MEGERKPKTAAKKARESVEAFLGVSGKDQKDWQENMNKWQRRSVAVHDDGQILGKVDKNRQSMHHRVSNASFGQMKAQGAMHPAVKVKRPSALRMAYDFLRDKIDEAKLKSGMPKGEAPKKARIADTVPEEPERQLGKGAVGELLKREYRKSRMISEVRMNMANLTTYRPYFTYWVTFVQVVIFIVTVSLYGVGPIGIGYRKVEGNVPKVHMTIEPAYYLQEQNLWIGPSSESLIHVGAKFSPCMRTDPNIQKGIRHDRKLENQTGCCIYNDNSGCVQSQSKDCSALLSTWKRFPEPLGLNRTSGPVCGLDPRSCLNPKSEGSAIWPDDITRWPICLSNGIMTDLANRAHMTCDLAGRPCCIGLQGQCIITSDQHCKFLNGYFNTNATLCSQVFCLDAICGMIPFYTPGAPDQFGRLITAQFLHAGLLQLLITLIYQGFVMRDLERLIGWVRMAIIYLVSGIVGSLASAIFLPYHVEAGPSGSQFGIAACLVVEVIQNWYILVNPWMALLKLAAILLALFVIGLLPMIDNYAHLFGFIYGFLLAFALMPYITFNLQDRRQKLIGVIVCLILALVLFIILILLFYVKPIEECGACKYFNCVPFTNDFCVGMEIKINRSDIWFN